MMDPTIVFQLLIVGSLAYRLWSGTKQSDRRLRVWKDAAQSCGLQILATSPAPHPQLKARAGPVQVLIEGTQRSTGIVLRVPATPDFQHVTVRRVFQRDRGVDIGDPWFDRVFSVEGPMRLLLALLHTEARRWLIASSNESSIEISGGELRAILPDADVSGVLHHLLDMSRRLAPSEIPRHLAENVVQDPEPGVRFQSLLVLIAELPDRPETAAALRKACADPVPRIRLRAARELGAEAHGVVLKIAESLEDDELSAEAVAALSHDRALPFERANAVLDLALRRRRLRTARACLEALVPSREAAIEKLAKVLDREHGELALAAAAALGETATPAAEPPLIQALERQELDLRKAAAEALGRVGTAAAVLPLQEAGTSANRDLHRAARQAIDAIQSRLQGASPGQLSLAGGEAGRLSLAQDGGELSLADDPAGRLSLGDEEKPA